MKNQYFGDVNDYFKYGMLRAFGRELSVAVIWMMTPDDGSSDGRKLAYLDGEGRRPHDPALFDWLRSWRRSGAERDVRLIEASGLLPNCRFFSEVVPDDPVAREDWLRRALEFAQGSDLVFFDPDNGLEVRSRRPGQSGWSKYIALSELQHFYDAGHSLLIYQHTSRTTRRDLIRAKLRQMYEQFELEHFTTLAAFDWIGLLVDNGDHLLELSRAGRRIVLDWDTAIYVANNVVIAVPESSREIAERPARGFRKRMDRLTTTPGYMNRNRQEVVRATGLPGTDHGQSIYVLRCGSCQKEYGVNGSGIFQAKCPTCQGGAADLAYDAVST